MKNTSLYSDKAINKFLDEAFEVAFGDNAINKGYTMKEVIAKLQEFSDKALHLDELREETLLELK